MTGNTTLTEEARGGKLLRGVFGELGPGTYWGVPACGSSAGWRGARVQGTQKSRRTRLYVELIIWGSLWSLWGVPAGSLGVPGVAEIQIERTTTLTKIGAGAGSRISLQTISGG